MKIIKKKLGESIPIVKNDGKAKARSVDLAQSFLKCSSCNHKLKCETCTCQCPNNNNIIQTKGVEHEILTHDQLGKLMGNLSRNVIDGKIELPGFTRDENGNLVKDGSTWKLVVVDGKLEVVIKKDDGEVE